MNKSLLREDRRIVRRRFCRGGPNSNIEPSAVIEAPNSAAGAGASLQMVPSIIVDQPLPASSSPYSTIYEYWPDKQLKRETAPVHHASGSRHSVSYEYDKLRRVRKAEDELGVTETQYFTQQRKTIVKDPLLNETETITDELGRTKMVTAPNPSVPGVVATHGRPVTQFQYNRQNRTVKAIASDSSSVLTLSDHLGRTIQESFWSTDQSEMTVGVTAQP